MARGTVELVFEQLALEGCILRRQGAGSVVAPLRPDALIAANDQTLATLPCPREPVPCASPAPTPEVRLQTGVPFIARLADPTLLEQRHLQLTTDTLATITESVPHAGDESLRQAIATHIRLYRGIECDADDIVVTQGIRHTLHFISQWLERDDAIALEDPGYSWAARLFEQTGRRVICVAVDQAGLDVEQLARHDKVRAVHTTPAHQAPLGVCMSVQRRQALLAWAQARDAYIVEDDYDSEYNYACAPLPAIKALDQHDRVLFCGSFNKTLFSGLRLGFAVVPRALRTRFIDWLAAAGQTPGVIAQRTVRQYLVRGHYERHLRIARQTYQRRRDLLLERLAAMPGMTISGEQSGLHFVLWLPEGVSEQVFCDRARQRGLVLQPIGLFCRRHTWPAGVLIGYAALTDEQIETAAQALVEVYRASLSE
ncbi:GntR family transcriptional regulator [Pseudomonas mosselii]|nr:GntR family transcriptional regulator [Pseudomonas mosselii]